MSSDNAGDIPILQEEHSRTIDRGMNEYWLNIDKLMADMADHVSRTSARQFSLAVTKGRNPDWYRNFLGKDVAKKRPGADVFLGITQALGRDPSEYMAGGVVPTRHWPSTTTIANTLAALLESVGVNPYEDERAYKIALRFPDALHRAEILSADLHRDQDGKLSGPDPELS